MILIPSFSRGLVTNIEGVARPWETAQYVRDCRSDELGWLIPRRGQTRISEETGFTDVFVHKGVLLVVVNGYLRWARLGEIGEQIEFNDFVEGGYLIKDGDERVVFQTRDDLVFIGTGRDSYVVDVSGGTPIVDGFYGQVGGIKLSSYRPTRTENKYVTAPLNAEQSYDNLEDRVKDSIHIEVIDVFAQPVLEIGGERVLLNPTNAHRAEVNSWDGNQDQATFGNEGKWRAELTIVMESVAPEFMVSQNVIIELYATRRVDQGDTPGRDFYRLPTTIPYQPGTTRGFRFLNDDSSLGEKSVFLPGKIIDRPNFSYMAVNEFRSYVAEEDSDRIWHSYYNAERNERYFQNFTDFIKLQLQGGSITGLKFIRDNLLVVYATNQIQLIATDPLAELHRVVDFISPQDDVGNPIGCIAPDAIVDMGGTHWFLAANQYVYAFNGRSARTMSDLVRVMFQFVYEKDFYISIPSMLEENATDEPNTTLLYQPQYRRWWQDSFGVHSITKGYPERLFVVIEGKLYELYKGATDDGTPVRRVWRNNPFASRVQTRYESVHVYPQAAADIDIKAITELETFETQINVSDPADIFSCRAGCNLRGRLLNLEIATQSTAVIDRITINEKLRNQ